ncbi:MAG: TrkA family potassium uptake protein [Anaerolineaceae bacterium]|jgi:trk system potassium uptake protein TrkA
MQIIVVGCGRLGSELAYRLFKQGHFVAVVDSNSASFANLPADFEGRLHEGDALNQDVLRRAGIEKAHGLAAVTNNDALNVAIGHIAKAIYGLDNVIVRNYDPQSRSLFEAFGLQVVSSTSWGAQRIEELLFQHDIRTVFSAGNGEVEVYEVAIPQNWEGHKVSDLMCAGNAVAISISRSGRAMLPDPQLNLIAGDVILFGATFEGLSAIRDFLFLNQQERAS